MDESNVSNDGLHLSDSNELKRKFILRQRIEQNNNEIEVTRLRAKLLRERALRDQVDVLSDDDVNKLISYINSSAGHYHRRHEKSLYPRKMSRSVDEERDAQTLSIPLNTSTKLSKKLPKEPIRNEAYFLNEINECSITPFDITEANINKSRFIRNRLFAEHSSINGIEASASESKQVQRQIGEEIVKNNRISEKNNITTKENLTANGRSLEKEFNPSMNGFQKFVYNRKFAEESK